MYMLLRRDRCDWLRRWINFVWNSWLEMRFESGGVPDVQLLSKPFSTFVFPFQFYVFVSAFSFHNAVVCCEYIWKKFV